MRNDDRADIGQKELRQAASCACFSLRKAARSITQRYDDALRPAGLRATQFSLLAVLRARAPLTVNELADAAATDRTTLTRNLKPLERDGLVRSRAGDDRRVRELLITAKGRRTLANAYPLWRQAQQDLRRLVGASQMNDLVAGAQLVVTNTRGA